MAANAPQLAPVEHVTDYGSREAWLAARRRGVGASESAVLFDLSPWDSRHTLWLKKTGRLSDTLINDDAEWLENGRIIEPAIAEMYRRKTGRKLWQFSEFAIAQHPRLPAMFATPDQWVLEAPDRPGEGVLQLKMRVGGDWSEGPPLYVQCQIQHELAVTGRDWGAVALFDRGQIKHWDIERQPDFIAQLEEACVEFWGLVERNEPPPIDGHRATLEAIKRLHPLDNGLEVALDEEAAAAWAELCSAKEAAKAAEERQDAAEALLRQAIGENTFGRLPDGRLLSLKTTAVKAYSTNHEARTYRTLREVRDAGAGIRRPAKRKAAAR